MCLKERQKEIHCVCCVLYVYVCVCVCVCVCVNERIVSVCACLLTARCPLHSLSVSLNLSWVSLRERDSRWTSSDTLSLSV